MRTSDMWSLENLIDARDSPRLTMPFLHGQIDHFRNVVIQHTRTPFPTIPGSNCMGTYSGGLVVRASKLGACSHCVWPKRTLFFTWMRFDHIFDNFASTRKLPLCDSDFRHELRETRTNSRFHKFGIQELSSELSFRIGQSVSTS